MVVKFFVEAALYARFGYKMQKNEKPLIDREKILQKNVLFPGEYEKAFADLTLRVWR